MSRICKLRKGSTRFVVTAQFSYCGLIEGRSAIYEEEVLHLRANCATRLLEDCGMIEQIDEAREPQETISIQEVSKQSRYACAACGWKSSGPHSNEYKGKFYCYNCFDFERNAPKRVASDNSG